MTPAGSRAKGKRAERAIAKMVMRAFCDYGISSKDCYRTPSSGAHPYAKLNDPGDLVMSPKLRKLFPYHVEVKDHANVNIAHLLIPAKQWKKDWKFGSWFKQVTTATRKNLYPMLVFHTTGRFWMAAVADLLAPTTPCLILYAEKRKWYVVEFKRYLQDISTNL